jgi:hypothetical protein
VFAVLKAAKDLKTKENAEFMHDLIGIACAPHSEQRDLDDLRRIWREIKNNAVPEFKIAMAEMNADGTPTLPWKQATALMFQQMAVFKKVNYGG